MEHFIVNVNQCALFYKNGRLRGVLNPGSYSNYEDRAYEVFNREDWIITEKVSAEELLSNPYTAKSLFSVTVPKNHIMLHQVGGVYKGYLCTGKYVFFKEIGHKFIPVSTIDPVVPDRILSIVKPFAPTLITEYNVAEYERGRLLYNNRFVKLLEPGRYFFWSSSIKKVELFCIDIRAKQLTTHGRELMTADKVTLRISLVCTVRVTDCKKYGAIRNPYEQLHIAAQLALRNYVSKKKLVEILENKAAMSEYIAKKLTSKASKLYLELKDVGVSNITLPGKFKAILNTVARRKAGSDECHHTP